MRIVRDDRARAAHMSGGLVVAARGQCRTGHDDVHVRDGGRRRTAGLEGAEQLDACRGHHVGVTGLGPDLEQERIDAVTRPGIGRRSGSLGQRLGRRE